ncbi:hypothetical protein V8F06_014620 [Rhypophila decipiens]
MVSSILYGKPHCSQAWYYLLPLPSTLFHVVLYPANHAFYCFPATLAHLLRSAAAVLFALYMLSAV